MRLFHVLIHARAAQSVVAYVARFRVQLANRSAAVGAFLRRRTFTGISERIFEMPDENDFALGQSEVLSLPKES